MPFVTVKLIEGRTLEQKRRMVAGVTAVVAEACGVGPERVSVFIEEMTLHEYARGGRLMGDWPPEWTAAGGPPAKQGLAPGRAPRCAPRRAPARSRARRARSA